jgi:hypothetical protein
LSFYHNFHDTNVKFYHSRKFKIYIIFKNNFIYVGTMIIKYNFNISWNTSKMTFDPNYIIHQFSLFLHNYFFLGSLWCSTPYWRAISKAIQIYLDQFLKILFEDSIVYNGMDNHFSNCVFTNVFFWLSINYTLHKNMKNMINKL